MTRDTRENVIAVVGLVVLLVVAFSFGGCGKGGLREERDEAKQQLKQATELADLYKAQAKSVAHDPTEKAKLRKEIEEEVNKDFDVRVAKASQQAIQKNNETLEQRVNDAVKEREKKLATDWQKFKDEQEAATKARIKDLEDQLKAERQKSRWGMSSPTKVPETPAQRHVIWLEVQKTEMDNAISLFEFQLSRLRVENYEDQKAVQLELDKTKGDNWPLIHKKVALEKQAVIYKQNETQLEKMKNAQELLEVEIKNRKVHLYEQSKK